MEGYQPPENKSSGENKYSHVVLKILSGCAESWRLYCETLIMGRQLYALPCLVPILSEQVHLVALHDLGPNFSDLVLLATLHSLCCEALTLWWQLHEIQIFPD